MIDCHYMSYTLYVSSYCKDCEVLFSRCDPTVFGKTVSIKNIDTSPLVNARPLSFQDERAALAEKDNIDLNQVPALVKSAVNGEPRSVCQGLEAVAEKLENLSRD